VLAASVTVKVLPAIVRVPVRELDPVLASTVKPTLAEPVPLAPVVTEIHAALLAAAHAQPAGEVSATMPLPPLAPKLCDVGEIALLQGPACVTVIHWPPITIEPVRLSAPVLGSTVKVAVPGPLPMLLVEIQRAADAAIQLHPGAVSTSTEPVPPAAATLIVIGVMV
jgi:hypothetical protein